MDAAMINTIPKTIIRIFAAESGCLTWKLRMTRTRKVGKDLRKN
jgi:hypothetical protein